MSVGWLRREFHLISGLLIGILVVSAFSRTIGPNLLVAPEPRPIALWLHALFAFGWVAFYIAQAALVRFGQSRRHRELGWIGAATGFGAWFAGLTATVVMARFNVQVLARPIEDAAAFVAIPLNDILGFGTALILAIVWRRKPAHHRRLMYIATCTLTAAAWVRVPLVRESTPMAFWWYGGVDVLVLLSVANDWLLERKVHVVNRIALPLLLVGQATAMYILLSKPAWWIKAVSSLILG